jgi:drug/metabolite transporter superfamily protein YnfA
MTESQQHRREAAVQKAAVFLGFVPWIVFSVVAGPSTWMWAALAALICSLVLAVPDWRRSRSISVLDAAGLVFFAVMVVLAFVLDRETLQPIEDRAQLLASIVIALVAFGSLAFGRPFTEYYAKREVPPEVWTSPTFKKINRVLTALWGTVFVINALCDLAAVAGASPDLFNWVIPIVVIVVAVKLTAWYPEHVSSRLERSGAQDASRPPAQPA